MNEYLANLSGKTPKTDLTVDSYVRWLDAMADGGRQYRTPSTEPATKILGIPIYDSAGWMHPKNQMLATLNQFKSEFQTDYGCSYTVDQRSRQSYDDIGAEVREGNLVIIHLMKDPTTKAQLWIGGSPHTLGPVIKMDDKEITLLDTGETSKTVTMSKEQFMKQWGRSSNLRTPLLRWMPDWLQLKFPFYDAYTAPRTMTVITPDTGWKVAGLS